MTSKGSVGRLTGRLELHERQDPPDIGWQIGIADIDATGSVTDVRRLKFDQEALDEMHPAWSPDSTFLAFQMEKEGINQIALARADGSGLRMVGPRVVNRNGLGYAWAPDGRTLLISAQPNIGDVAGASSTLWSVHPASGEATDVEGPTVRIPAWQRLAP